MHKASGCTYSTILHVCKKHIFHELRAWPTSCTCIAASRDKYSFAGRLTMCSLNIRYSKYCIVTLRNCTNSPTFVVSSFAAFFMNKEPPWTDDIIPLVSIVTITKHLRIFAPFPIETTPPHSQLQHSRYFPRTYPPGNVRVLVFHHHCPSTTLWCLCDDLDATFLPCWLQCINYYYGQEFLKYFWCLFSPRILQQLFVLLHLFAEPQPHQLIDLLLALQIDSAPYFLEYTFKSAGISPNTVQSSSFLIP